MTMYSLVGAITHRRLSEGCGHYTSFVRSQIDTSQWLHTDDDQV